MPNFSPITKRRFAQFKANKRGFWSLWIFLIFLVMALSANIIANSKPIILSYKNTLYFPVVKNYPEKLFGGDFETEADYRDPYVQDLITKDGWIIWAPIKYSYDTINYNLPTPAPSAPTADNILGTDDQGRDVFARVLYGFRISVLFGLALTVFSSLIGVTAGAFQGFYGGKVDLIAQRFIEIWSSMPSLYILIIFSALLPLGFGHCFSSSSSFHGHIWLMLYGLNFSAHARLIMCAPHAHWALETLRLCIAIFSPMRLWQP